MACGATKSNDAESRVQAYYNPWSAPRLCEIEYLATRPKVRFYEPDGMGLASPAEVPWHRYAAGKSCNYSHSHEPRMGLQDGSDTGRELFEQDLAAGSDASREGSNMSPGGLGICREGVKVTREGTS